MSFGFITDEDKSDHLTYCVRTSSLVSTAKWTYYAVKLLKTIKALPPPPP